MTVVEVLVVLVVDPGAHRGVERRQDLGALGLLGGDGHPHRPPGLLQALAVLLGQVAALVEHRQAHDVEVHLDIADLLDLEDPARRDPAPRAQRVEPEIGDGLLGHIPRSSRSKVGHPFSTTSAIGPSVPGGPSTHGRAEAG